MTKKAKSASPPPEEYASAMDKIRDEMAKSRDNYVQVVGEYMTGYLLDHPEAEAALMEKGKSISGSLEAVRKEAEKVKQGDMAILDDRTVFGIVRGYFGIKSEAEMPKTEGDVLKTPGNVIERHTNQKPSPSGEGGTAQAVTDEVASHTIAPDPFDLNALLGVI